MKAALILDEMPKKCIDCEYIFHNERTDHYICGVPNNHIDVWGRETWTSSWIDKMERPDWCPLQEVEPVRHGMWYEKKASFGDYVYEVCSVCGEERYMESIYPDEAGYYYCPNCGAKMDWEWRDDDDGGAE